MIGSRRDGAAGLVVVIGLHGCSLYAGLGGVVRPHLEEAGIAQRYHVFGGGPIWQEMVRAVG
jgi:hypothetical protein